MSEHWLHIPSWSVRQTPGFGFCAAFTDVAASREKKRFRYLQVGVFVVVIEVDRGNRGP